MLGAFRFGDRHNGVSDRGRGDRVAVKDAGDARSLTGVGVGVLVGALGDEHQRQACGEGGEGRARSGVAHDDVAAGQERRQREPPFDVYVCGLRAERSRVVQLADGDDEVQVLVGEVGQERLELVGWLNNRTVPSER